MEGFRQTSNDYPICHIGMKCLVPEPSDSLAIVTCLALVSIWKMLDVILVNSNTGSKGKKRGRSRGQNPILESCPKLALHFLPFGQQ